jgi:hypothetical protein
MRLLTNNPRKFVGLQGYGLSVSAAVPLEIPASDSTRKYLKTKKDKLGHTLRQSEDPSVSRFEGSKVRRFEGSTVRGFRSTVLGSRPAQPNLTRNVRTSVPNIIEPSRSGLSNTRGQNSRTSNP